MTRSAHAVFILSLFAALLIAGTAGAEPQYPRIVHSDGGLRLRSSPELKGTVLGVIPDGTEVQLLEEKSQVLTISGATGKWTRVWAPDQGEGWVFGGFLFDSRSFLKAIAGSYDYTGDVEPGDAPTWLTITQSVIFSGYGGNVEANWYCSVSKVTTGDASYTIEGNVGIRPTTDEIRWLAKDAVSKGDLTIVKTAADTITIGNETYKRRR
jgi:hypothetical protein